MMIQTNPPLLLGAHCSAAGGAYRALLEGVEIGASCIQFFTANQRRWESPSLSQEMIDLWKETLAKSEITHVMSHDSYLINLGAPDPEILEKSRVAFRKELERCLALGVTYLNFHPGASLHSSSEECAHRIIESLLLMRPTLEKKPHSLTLLIENTAGQGSSYGDTFEELAVLIEGCSGHLPLGICIDTCHAFAAGYDLRTVEAWDQTLKKFDEIVGLSHLKAMHLNDSMKGLGSRVDRHQALGQGQIGLESFRFVMQDHRLKSLPKYLETPGGPPLWTQEIQLLKNFAHAR